MVDLYCEKHIINLNEYQLIGSGCLSLASKYCESNNFIPLNSLVYYSVDAFTIKQLLEIEIKILQNFDWNLNFETCDTILTKFTLDLDGNLNQIHNLGSDLLVIVYKGFVV
jgi:hypothetical protein